MENYQDEQTSEPKPADGYLMLYLADELPAQQRLSVERQLANDAAFASRFQELQARHQWLDRSMKALDSLQPLPGNSAALQRGAARSIKQWQVRRALQPSYFSDSRGRFATWMYAAAAAAVVLIAATGYWGLQAPKLSPAHTDQVAVNDSSTGNSDNVIPDDPLQNTGNLADAESQLTELSELRTSVQ